MEKRTFGHVSSSSITVVTREYFRALDHRPVMFYKPTKAMMIFFAAKALFQTKSPALDIVMQNTSAILALKLHSSQSYHATVFRLLCYNCYQHLNF